MMKKNDRGFALVETLVVASFISSILVILYANLYPIMGEIEKRENFDDIESVYKTYLVKKMIEKDSNKSFILSGLSQNNFREINCSDYDSSKSNSLETYKNYCLDMKEQLHIDRMYVTTYRVGSNASDTAPNTIKSYISSFSENGTKCTSRVVVRYKEYANEEVEATDDKPIYKFSTMGVDCH